MPGIMLVTRNIFGNKTQSLPSQRGLVIGTHKMHITSRCFIISKKPHFASSVFKKALVQI